MKDRRGEGTDELKRLLTAATPEPWAYRKVGAGTFEVIAGLSGNPPFRPDVDAKITDVVVGAGDAAPEEGYTLGAYKAADAALIAALRNAAPELLAVVEAARGVLREWDPDRFPLAAAIAGKTARDDLRRALAKLDEART